MPVTTAAHQIQDNNLEQDNPERVNPRRANPQPEHLELTNSQSAKFEHFIARFAHLFRRTEPRMQMGKYIQALLQVTSRKNGWQIAQAVGDQLPDSTQRLLYLSMWDADVARDILQQFIIDKLRHKQAIGIIGDVGFYKKGNSSVGVQRQRNPSTGHRENCQIATFLSYASPQGHVLLDRRLYLPEAWSKDHERLQRVKVPADITYNSRSAHAAAMLEAAQRQNAPMQWIAGRLLCKNGEVLRATARQQQQQFVLGCDEDTHIFSDDTRTARTVGEVVDAWPSTRWQRLTVAPPLALGLGKQTKYQWARERVQECVDGVPGPNAWLIARRLLDKKPDTAYFLSNTPGSTTFRTLAGVALADQAFNDCIEAARDTAGLDQYEVRHWHSWHRHITLSMMALAWQASVQS